MTLALRQPQYIELQYDTDPILQKRGLHPREYEGTTRRGIAVSGGRMARALPCQADSNAGSNPMSPRQAASRPQPDDDAIGPRVAALDWERIAASLDAHGCAVAGPLLGPAECAALAGLYTQEAGFRSRVIMARHGFGRGCPASWQRRRYSSCSPG